MKLRFRVAVSDGAGQRFSSGQVADIDEDRAKLWLGLGYADSVDGPRQSQAVSQAPRQATAKKAAAPRKRAAKKAAKPAPKK